jgi:hypothetical protein
MADLLDMLAVVSEPDHARRLTDLYGDFERCARNTFDGQAAPAGWKAPDLPCGKCRHFRREIAFGGKTIKAKRHYGRCLKRIEIERHAKSAPKAFPDCAPACQYFEGGGNASTG